MILLESLSIGWIDRISIENRKEIIIYFIALGQPLNICFQNILIFNLYTDLSNLHNIEVGVVIDIKHEYRKLNHEEFNSYPYQLNSLTKEDKSLFLNKKHIIHLEGDVLLDIICDTITIISEQ